MSNQISFELLPQDEAAAKIVFDWRNDPVTIANSGSQKGKVWPDFLTEYMRGYFHEAGLPGYFILNNGKRSGIVGLDRSASINGLQTATVSINIAPEARGLGLGKLALKALSERAKACGIQCLLAEIRSHNEPSIKAFSAAGYQLHQKQGDLLQYILPLVETFKIPGTSRLIGEGQPCYIIAEAGSNWKIGSDEENQITARALIDAAKAAGADAVKFQTFRAKNTYVSNAGDSNYLKQTGEVRNVFDLIADLEMPYEMVAELKVYADKAGIDFLTTAFSVDDLQAIDAQVAIHKIASYENTHLRLIEAAAKTGKPTIMSTGASKIDEIEWSVDYFKSLSQAPLILMQCTASYPAPPESVNVRTLPYLKNRFNCLVGLSDHSRDPLCAPIAATTLGAAVIEKHFTLDNNLPGPDHRYAIEPDELKAMVAAVRNTERILGDACKGLHPAENELYLFAKRALQATADIAEGEELIEGKNYDILRPGSMPKGIHPKYTTQVHKSRASKAIKHGHGLEMDSVQSLTKTLAAK